VLRQLSDRTSIGWDLSIKVFVGQRGQFPDEFSEFFIRSPDKMWNMEMGIIVHKFTTGQKHVPVMGADFMNPHLKNVLDGETIVGFQFKILKFHGCDDIPGHFRLAAP